MKAKVNNDIVWQIEQFKMHYLYQEILMDYKQRLIQTWKINPHLFPFESEEKINRFIDGIKFYYNRLPKMYDKVVKQRATGIQKTIHEEPNFQDQQSKSESNQKNNSPQINIPLLEQLIKKETVQKVEADANAKKKQLLHINGQCKEKVQDDSSSSEDSQSGYVQKAEKLTQGLIYGLFHINSLKRKPDHIFLTFNDVFVKNRAGKDAFFDRGTLQLKRVDKSEAKIEQ